MKKCFKFALAAFAIVAAASCSKEMTTAEVETPSDGDLITFSATRENLTKTTLSSSLEVLWAADDQVAVWCDTTKATFSVTAGAGTTSASIAGTGNASATRFAALVPASAAAGSVADSTGLVEIPAQQSVSVASPVASSALISCAYETALGHLGFKNVVSLVKFTVAASEKIKSVTIKGNNSEVLAGQFTLNYKTGALTSTTASKTITVVPSDGETFADGTYYICVAPADFTLGLTLNFRKEDGVGIKTSATAATVARNSGINLGTVAPTTWGPFTIASVADLQNFAANVTAYAAADVVKFTADVDLDGVDWKTPGRYYGSIDGQNHRIYNVKMAGADGDVAVFGRIGDGTNGSYVKNIVFGSKDYDFTAKTGTYDGVSEIKFNTVNDSANTYYYPGAIAYVYANGTLENVVNFINVEATSACTSCHRMAGVAGTVKANVTLKNCVNYGAITDNSTTTAKAPTCAGLAGALDGEGCTVTGCENRGTITLNNAKSSDNGGLLGYVNYVATVSDCTNYGEVHLISTIGVTNYCGGIVGRSTKASTFTNCYNRGRISFERDAAYGSYAVFLGGIIGGITGATTYIGCENWGEIVFNVNAKVVTSCAIGGIFGRSGVAGATIKDCKNHGNVTFKTNTKATVEFYEGGILGSIVTGAPKEFSGCTNDGTITYDIETSGASMSVGGIAGRVHQGTPFLNCSNAGTVVANNSAATTYAGGVVGYNQATATTYTGCSNTGEVVFNATNTATGNVGGIVGYDKIASKYNACTNSGKITIKTAELGAPTYIGGVAGYLLAAAAVNECSFTGYIYAASETQKSSDNFKADGIANSAGSATITDCTNTGTITVAQ